jgi:phthiodiolone/phenolphthiodiolone dimycocerosates ketoreductase
MRANIMRARSLGADDIWIGDQAKSMFPSWLWRTDLSPMARFVPSLDAYLDPTVTMARAAGRFRPRMGTAVTDSVRRTRADLARTWLSLHHLSRGRVVLGIGSGEVENTEPYGWALQPRVARLEDTLVAIRAAWASGGEPLTHSGRFHGWRDATFALPEWRETTPPIWSRPKARARVGSLADTASAGSTSISAVSRSGKHARGTWWPGPKRQGGVPIH